MTDSNNEAEQNDEMLALESIYQDDFKSVCNVFGQRSGRITVQVYLTEEATFIEVDADGMPISNTLQRVAHLPPLVVTFTLPEGYPSSAPPQISIISTWLTREQRSELEMRAIGIWLLERSVMLYQYMELLSNLITELPLEFPLRVNENIAHSLVTFDRRAQQKEFDAGLYQCEICFESKRGRHCYRLACKHTYCRSCLNDYFTLMINEGNISGVRCPDAGCIQENARISDDDILDVVGPELYERYHKLFIKQKLEADPSVVWCPRRQCQGPAFKDGTHTTLAICQQCKLAFCTLCRKTWHGTEFCSIDNLQRLIEEYESADDARKKQLEAQYGAKNFMRIIQEATQEHQSITWIKEHTTECPTCGAHIEKTIGCNHMQCSTCNTHFCYLCGAYLSSTQPLKHFNIPGMPCYQRLFENLGANPEELVQLALAENN